MNLDADIPPDRELRITLPADVPVGPAEIVLVVSSSDRSNGRTLGDFKNSEFLACGEIAQTSSTVFNWLVSYVPKAGSAEPRWFSLTRMYWWIVFEAHLRQRYGSSRRRPRSLEGISRAQSARASRRHVTGRCATFPGRTVAETVAKSCLFDANLTRLGRPSAREAGARLSGWAVAKLSQNPTC